MTMPGAPKKMGPEVFVYKHAKTRALMFDVRGFNGERSKEQCHFLIYKLQAAVTAGARAIVNDKRVETKTAKRVRPKQKKGKR